MTVRTPVSFVAITADYCFNTFGAAFGVTRLHSENQNFYGVTVAPNGDVYVAVYGGGIHKLAGGSGSLVSLGQATRFWTAMASMPNGDILACAYDGGIYKQAGGVGDFVTVGEPNRNYFGICVAPNGDVYASTYNGDIYVQVGGTGSFAALGQTSREWKNIAAAPNGDILACVQQGDIYKRAAGAGNFVGLGQANRYWYGITATPNGNVYASTGVESTGNVYKQAGGIGNFTATPADPTLQWFGLSAASNGSIYATTLDGIYLFSGGCTATGEPCFNTFPTCKKTADYSRIAKQYRFVNNVQPLPLPLSRPYVNSVKLLPTEIKTNLSISGRVTVEMHDEPDTDVGVDPYLTQRSAFPNIPGTYWKKWLARNRNYKGRTIDIYEGYVGQAEAEYVRRWTGRLENITRSGMQVKIEAVDLLKDLSKIDVPPKLDLKLSVDITDSQDTLTIFGTNSAYGTDAALLDAPSGTLAIGEEIVTYTSIDPVTGIIGGLTRGAYGTAAATHSAKEKVGKVKVYADQNPFDLLKSMLLTDAAIASDSVDSAAFDYWRGYPGDEQNISAIVTEPTKLSVLFWELVDLVDCKVWVGEDLKITISRNLPNDLLRTFDAISDETGIVSGSGKVDQNEKSRLTRASIYWDKSATGKVDDPTAYGKLDIAIDATAESPNDYNETIEKKIMSRWIHSAGHVEEDMSRFVRNLAMRQVWRNRDASPIVTVDVDLKDEAIKTGGWVHLSTDELVDKFGEPFSGQEFQVVKRERKENVVTLSLLKGASGRCLMIAPDSLLGVDWAAATAAQKAYGAMCEDDGKMAGGDAEGYRIW